tara:strand:- start:91 stop:480 length:390 start_codon:yes stop_codon:yes gene_type:complete
MNAIQISSSVALFIFGCILIVIGLFETDLNHSITICGHIWYDLQQYSCSASIAWVTFGCGMIIAGVVLVKSASKPASKSATFDLSSSPATKQKPQEYNKESENKNNFCGSCGKLIPPAAKFCGICGTKV